MVYQELVSYITLDKKMEILPMPTNVSGGRDNAGGCLISVELMEFETRGPRPFATDEEDADDNWNYCRGQRNYVIISCAPHWG